MKEYILLIFYIVANPYSITSYFNETDLIVWAMLLCGSKPF